MKRLGKQCPGCVRKFRTARVSGYGSFVRNTLRRVKPGVYECVRCGHTERKEE